MSDVTVSRAPQGMPRPDIDPRFHKLLAHADDNLILAHRLGEWISKAPELEIDIALGNFALDHLGVARSLLQHAGQIEDEGRDEDDLAMLRTDREFFNLLLVEQPNGDFAHSIVRQFFIDCYQLQLWPDLATSDDIVVAGVAAKAVKEADYHFRFSRGWMLRMGDGTDESHVRAQTAVNDLWRFTGEIFEDDNGGYRSGWDQLIGETFEEAGLSIPDDPYQKAGGRVGYHTEHLGYLLTEMQWMQRTYPGVEW
ncbi:MAG TPA: 1,2-phenylacetyl-CoA epoxidase subunit PaaC [Acidimicrobiia bacterium]